MFCIADPPYDKSLQQLQSFLSGLVSEEKLELRDGIYFLKKWLADWIALNVLVRSLKQIGNICKSIQKPDISRKTFANFLYFPPSPVILHTI